MTADTNGAEGYSLGNRTERPHHPDGWSIDREDTANGDNPPRGTVGRGEHDRPKRD